MTGSKKNIKRKSGGTADDRDKGGTTKAYTPARKNSHMDSLMFVKSKSTVGLRKMSRTALNASAEPVSARVFLSKAQQEDKARAYEL